MDFKGFNKIPRLNKLTIVTEKIDGTNALIGIDDNNNIFAGSKNRWLTPGKSDNFGFAAWVEENKDELLKLGPGYHYGEYYGSGIQRGYGLTGGERRFILFNTVKWNEDNAPKCCEVVPVLKMGHLLEVDYPQIMESLKQSGSVAVPGYMKPEGIIVFHTHSNACFKMTFEHEDTGKGDNR